MKCFCSLMAASFSLSLQSEAFQKIYNLLRWLLRKNLKSTFAYSWWSQLSLHLIIEFIHAIRFLPSTNEFNTKENWRLFTVIHLLKHITKKKKRIHTTSHFCARPEWYENLLYREVLYRWNHLVIKMTFHLADPFGTCLRKENWDLAPHDGFGGVQVAVGGPDIWRVL